MVTSTLQETLTREYKPQVEEKVVAKDIFNKRPLFKIVNTSIAKWERALLKMDQRLTNTIQKNI